MANATVNFAGQVNGAGAQDALWLKVFGGEVITAFEQTTKLKDRVMNRQISSGKSATFPRLGRITAAYHTPGNEIVGTTQNFNEVVVTIDDLLIASAFISNLDEAKAYYDVRGPITTEMGRALATTWDRHLIHLGLIGARSANPVTGLPGGTQILTTAVTGTPNFNTSGSDLAAALFVAAQTMDNNFVPEDGRIAIVRPQQYYNLVQNTNLINQFFGGRGAISDGTIFKVAGFEMVKSPFLPNTDFTADNTVISGNANNSFKYGGHNFTNTSALCMHSSALGTVQLMDLSMEMAYDIRRQGTLAVGKFAVGHGVLRNEASVEILNAAVAAA